jgi:hypothetical protein
MDDQQPDPFSDIFSESHLSFVSPFTHPDDLWSVITQDLPPTPSIDPSPSSSSAAPTPSPQDAPQEHHYTETFDLDVDAFLGETPTIPAPPSETSSPHFNWLPIPEFETQSPFTYTPAAPEAPPADEEQSFTRKRNTRSRPTTASTDRPAKKSKRKEVVQESTWANQPLPKFGVEDYLDDRTLDELPIADNHKKKILKHKYRSHFTLPQEVDPSDQITVVWS